MRIMLVGNAPWCPSGYGEQIALLAPRFQALGHDVAVAANFGIQGTVVPWTAPSGGDPIPVFPANYDVDAAMCYFAEFHKADVVITLLDAWTRHPERWTDGLRVAMWAPIDHYPPPPKVVAVLGFEQVQAIAMSKFGHEWMQALPLKNDALYAPHAVDTDLLKPYPEMRDVMRDDLGIPRDAFLVGMVAANKGWNPQLSRKALPQAIEAFSRFCRKHDDAYMLCHTEMNGRSSGTNLETLITVRSVLDELEHGLSRKYLYDRIHFPSDREMQMGLPRTYLAAQYSMFDVLLNPSLSEGFGVPILEAQACGVPVITSDHSSMPELTHAGWIVKGDPFWDQLQESYAFMPYIPSIEEALEFAYAARDDQVLRASAVEWAQQYAIDAVVENHWVPILEQLSGPREVPPLNGKERKKARKRAAAEKRQVAA